jgi:hypothetical protein
MRFRNLLLLAVFIIGAAFLFSVNTVYATSYTSEIGVNGVKFCCTDNFAVCETEPEASMTPDEQLDWVVSAAYKEHIAQCVVSNCVEGSCSAINASSADSNVSASSPDGMTGSNCAAQLDVIKNNCVDNPNEAACKSATNYFLSKCDKSFDYPQAQLMDFAGASGFLSGEKSDFSGYGNKVIDPDMGEPYTCADGAQYCENESECTTYASLDYHWYDGACQNTPLMCSEDHLEACAEGSCTAAGLNWTGTECVKGGCADDSECTAEQFCGATGCETKFSVGSDCANDNQCVAGAKCKEGACAIVDVCTADSDCTVQQFCHATTKKCTTKFEAGKACVTSKVCKAGTICYESICTETCASQAACEMSEFCHEQVCHEKLNNGAACDEDFFCTSSFCLENLGMNGVCKPVSEACIAPCDDNEYCDPDAGAAAGACVSKKADPQPCASYIECTSGKCQFHMCGVHLSPCHPECDSVHYCDEMGAAPTCAPKIPGGAECYSSDQCITGACQEYKCAMSACDACSENQYCENDKCVLKLGTGSDCSESNECQSDNCKGDVCIEGYPKACSCAVGGVDPDPDCTAACGALPLAEAAATTLCVCTASLETAKLEGQSGCYEACGITPPGQEAAGDATEPGGEVFDSGGGTLPNFLGVTDPNVVFGRIIKFVIGFVGAIALIMFIYGGTLWLISAGRDDYIKKGAQTMTYAAIGLAITFAAYILVNFVFELFGK